MVALYNFPKHHWRHLRATSPVQAPFAALSARTAPANDRKKWPVAEVPRSGRRSASRRSSPGGWLPRNYSPLPPVRCPQKHDRALHRIVSEIKPGSECIDRRPVE